VADEATLMRVLRQFRRRVMVRIAWAQALELVSEESTLAAVERAGADADCRRARLALRRLL
jgi:glutamine synthetase adenylyltransferase